MFAFL